MNQNTNRSGFIFFICLMQMTLFSQKYFYNTYTISPRTASFYQCLKYNQKIIMAKTTLCEFFECSSIIQYDAEGNILWTLDLPNMDQQVG